MAKLLLVEDDNNLREIYEARLQAEGYTIVSAKDGEEALVVAKAEKPDLVISDVMMPKISGFEMLDILRNTEELKGVKVIMLTALGQSDDQKRADKLGADRYLVKSQVTLEDIVKVTHELLGDQAGGGSDGPAPSGDNPAPGGDAPASAGDAPAPAADDSAGASDAAPYASASDGQPDAQATAGTPEPAPAAPEPEPAPKPDAAATDKAAKSTVQEEADVEAKIEDFVAGASTEPTAPASAAAEPPADDSGSADDQKTQDAPQSSSEASDDKLMADAVETLVASTDDKGAGKAAAAPASNGVTTIPVTTSPEAEQEAAAAKPDDAAAAGSEPDKDDEAKDDSGDSSGGVKKIIKPIDSPPKKDINQLLAEEEAKEAQSIPGATIAGAGSAEPEDKAAGEPMAPPSAAAEHGSTVTSVDSEPDPGSIAL